MLLKCRSRSVVRVCNFLPLYTWTLLLDRVSQNKLYTDYKSFVEFVPMFHLNDLNIQTLLFVDFDQYLNEQLMLLVDHEMLLKIQN